MIEINWFLLLLILLLFPLLIRLRRRPDDVTYLEGDAVLVDESRPVVGLEESVAADVFVGRVLNQFVRRRHEHVDVGRHLARGKRGRGTRQRREEAGREGTGTSRWLRMCS